MRHVIPRTPKGLSREAVFERKIIRAIRSIMPINSETVWNSHTTRGVYSRVKTSAKKGSGGRATTEARWA